MPARNFDRMTLEEFNEIDQQDNYTYELIDGVVMMSPRPSTRHQRILTNLTIEVGNALKKSPCNASVETEIEIAEEVMVPDLFIYCDESHLGPQRYNGAPIIVVEILSPSTAFNDLNIKLRKYQAAGVKEYWIISQDGEIVTVHYFDSKVVKEFVQDQRITSEVIDSISIEVNNLF